jgi:hypothetical protein
MKSTPEMGILSLRIQDTLVKARAPSYLEVYECSFDHPLSELASAENELVHLADTGI